MLPTTTLDGSFLLEAPCEEALPLFTPEGERAWVPGWAPTYPAGRPEHPEPGTVFTTRTGDTTTIWIVLEHSASRMRYARVAADRTAGLVTVTCRPQGHSRCSRIGVTYSLTALSDAGIDDIRDLEQDYEGYLRGWQVAASAALGGAGMSVAGPDAEASGS
jgi:hypothetical protein